jgi:hypothetical protein
LLSIYKSIIVCTLEREKEEEISPDTGAKNFVFERASREYSLCHYTFLSADSKSLSG